MYESMIIENRNRYHMKKNRAILLLCVTANVILSSVPFQSDPSPSYYQMTVANALDSWTLAQIIAKNENQPEINNSELMLGCLLKMYAGLMLEHEQPESTQILLDAEFWQHIHEQITNQRSAILSRDPITARGIEIILHALHNLLHTAPQ
jgi:hypothetical protein